MRADYNIRQLYLVNTEVIIFTIFSRVEFRNVYWEKGTRNFVHT